MAGEQFAYVIVGGGVAGNSAVEGIRELDKKGKILMVGGERDLPYDRPPLSKQLWKGDQKIEEIFKHDAGYYRENGVEVRLGVEVVGLDVAAKTVQLGNGAVVGYGKLLLATGGTPRRLDIPGGDLACYYRTVED